MDDASGRAVSAWRGFLGAVAWTVFPLVPALLGRGFVAILTPGSLGPDPEDWAWDEPSEYLLFFGPLLGFAFLAGATLGLPGAPGRRPLRKALGSRAVWVGLGPWVGPYSALGLFWLVVKLEEMGWFKTETWPKAVQGICVWSLILLAAFGWVVFAVAALRRARRHGAMKRALRRGVVMTVLFLGTWLGVCYGMLAAMPAYFYDPTPL